MRSWRRILASAGVAMMAAVFYPGSSAATEFTSKDYRVGHQPGVVAVADFNGDGKLDLVVLNGGSRNVSILLGNGDGTFQATKNFDVGGDNPPSIVVADFNGDGKADLGVAIPGNIPAPATTFPTCTQSSVNLMVGNGDGTFQTARRAVTVDSANLSVTAGDLNEDGKADLVVARSQIDPACPLAGGSVFLGKGDGSFQTAKEVAAAPGVLIADFNSDGKPDLLAWEPFNSPSEGILLGNGDGTFQSPLALPSLPGCGLFCRQILPDSTTGDFNGDGKLDIALARGLKRCFDACSAFPFSFDTIIMLGNGDGTFQTATSVGSGGSFLLSGDFNGDGKADIAFGSGDVQGFHVLLGKGDGTFSGPFAFDTGSGPVSFTVAELNGDHLPDIVLANMNDDTISIAVNMSPTSGADLSVRISAGPEPVSVTQNLTYTVPVINSGPEDATNVTLKDTLPAGANFVSATITQGGCTQASLVVTCNAAKLVSGDAAVATIVVVPMATGTASNTASVSATQSDLVSGNNGASHSTRVDPMFTLKVTKSGAGSGTVATTGFGSAPNAINCGSTCTASLPTGTFVNLQTSPDSNSVFGSWGGACAQNFLSAGCDITMNSDQSVSATFDTAPNFFLAADATSLSVKRGGSISTTISIFPEGNSFGSAIALTCAVDGPTPKPSCTLSPTSLTPGPDHVISMLTISTPALAAALNRGAEPGSAGPLHAAWLLPGLALLGIASGSRKAKARGRQRLVLCGLLAGMLAWQAGCGGGSNTPPPPPPPQTFTVTVTATSGSISKTAQISVTVR